MKGSGLRGGMYGKAWVVNFGQMEHYMRVASIKTRQPGKVDSYMLMAMSMRAVGLKIEHMASVFTLV